MTRIGVFFLAAALALPSPRPAAAQETEEVEVVRRPFGTLSAPSRGWLGITFVEEDGAVVVEDVFPGSPAERAGLLSGDVLLRLRGEEVSMATMRRLRTEPGDTVRLRLRRDGGEREVTVVAGPRPRNVVIVRGGERERIVLDADSIRRSMAVRMDTLATHLDSLLLHVDSLRHYVLRRVRPGEIVAVEIDTLIARHLPETLPFSIEVGSRALAGAEFTQMNPGLGRYFRTDEGLLTLRVAPGSPAARAGLEAGDVVLRAGGEEVETLRDLRRALVRAERNDRERVTLEVLREGTRREVELEWRR